MSLYPNSGAVFRGDLNTFVEEGARQRSNGSVNDWFIGGMVLPEFGVDLKEGQYPKFEIGGTGKFKDQAGVRAPGGTYPEVSRAFTSDTYSCVDRGLKNPVDDAQASNYSRFFDMEMKAADWTRQQVQLSHEIRVADLVMSTSSFSATSAAVDYTTANLATINFTKDVFTVLDIIEGRGESANTIIMSRSVWLRIRQSTLFKSDMQTVIPSPVNAGQINVSPSMVQQYFQDNGITQVLIGRAQKDTSKSKTASLSNVWSNAYIWVGDVQAGDPMAGGAGRTFAWTGDGGLFVTETYRDEDRRSNMVRVRQHTDEKIVNANSGQLITTSYA